ncbi:MAG: hypothetical protein V7629_09500 [Motiliproteus sp.]
MKSKQQRNKQKRQERRAVLVISLAVFAIVGFGMVYKAELIPAEATIEPEQSQTRISQLCQQKLLDHIKKGGVDLQAEMSYGDLQGCTFASESEQRKPKTQDIEMSIINRDSIL